MHNITSQLNPPRYVHIMQLLQSLAMFCRQHYTLETVMTYHGRTANLLCPLAIPDVSLHQFHLTFRVLSRVTQFCTDDAVEHPKQNIVKNSKLRCISGKNINKYTFLFTLLFSSLVNPCKVSVCDWTPQHQHSTVDNHSVHTHNTANVVSVVVSITSSADSSICLLGVL